MDKIIEKKTGWRVAFTKKALPWWLGALLLAFVVYLIARPNNKTLRVDKDTLTVSSAVMGEFNDYIRISGRVQPMTTIQLSPQEGGMVQAILIEEGSIVKAGDPILVLSNDNLDLQILNSEAELWFSHKTGVGSTYKDNENADTTASFVHQGNRRPRGASCCSGVQSGTRRRLGAVRPANKEELSS